MLQLDWSSCNENKYLNEKTLEQDGINADMILT